MAKCLCGKETFLSFDMCAPCLIVELLVTEHGVERDKARELVRSRVDIVVNGIMRGDLRATAMVLGAIERARRWVKH